MAPVRTITKECFTRIRNNIENSVVSIFQHPIDNTGRLCGKKTFIGSGFVFSVKASRCIVLTVSRNLNYKSRSKDMQIFVRFDNGHTFEGDIIRDGTASKLVAIMVYNLDFAPVEVQVSPEEAVQCEPVVHMGFFDAEYDELNLSSGSVGFTGHEMHIDSRTFTSFSHCCSSKADHIGGPVFNLCGKFVGVNYSKRLKRNIFFAFNLEQFERELELLFGTDWKLEVLLCFKDRRKRKRP